MRIASLFAAALLCAAVSPAVATGMSIGTPPQRQSTSSGDTAALARTQARYEAQLAAQQESYDMRVSTLRSQLASLQKQKTAWLEKESLASARISELASQVQDLKAGASSSNEQVQSLIEENRSLRDDQSALVRTRAEQEQRIDALTADNRLLTQRASSTRPLVARDPVDWIVLATGLALGGLIGMAIGLKRGEERAIGGPIPENVAAWWDAETRETPSPQE